ncbi:DUF2635 domain-containing protein [Pseudomonas segetis]|uniref:DUF2635 domain-containing protein n=1 Tax=Pseudomonas segetis TaxID=298908 RepID=A0A239JPC1_9PSED|nr:DUF2635 domain-containing protein [Pseudomonas segetis]SNT07697.1 Protein of unknown function [Pseudomonas segetis]
MNQRTIKPAEAGLIVRRPDNAKPLAAQGESVTWSPYWQRRLADGSVVAVPKMAQETPAKEKAQAVTTAKNEGKQ